MFLGFAATGVRGKKKADNRFVVKELSALLELNAIMIYRGFLETEFQTKSWDNAGSQATIIDGKNCIADDH